MKCSINTETLKSALVLIEKVAERKVTIPVLATVRFEVRGDKLSLTATDLDNYLTIDVDADITMPGCACLPARQLRQISETVADGVIDLECENSTARLSQGNLSYKLWTTSADAFPEIPKFASTPIAASSAHLQALIDHTIFSITQEEGRYTLSGAKVLIDKTGTTFVTTDGHRLSLAKTNKIVSKKPVDTLVSRRVLNILRDLSHLTDTMQMGFDETRLYVQAANVQLTSRFLSGRFPKWEAVLPKTFARSVEFDSDEWANALRQIMIAADPRTHYMHIDFADGAATLRATNSGDKNERAQVLVPAIGTGEPVTLGFNGRYLREVISVHKGRVALDINTPNSQVGVRLLGDSLLDSYQHVLMPCR